MRKTKGTAAACCIALLLLCTALPAQATVFYSDVRVLLSIGKQQTFSFTPVGTFTLQEYPELTVGNDALEISVAGGRVQLQIGGKSVTAPSLTLLCGDYGGRADYIRLRNAEHGTCTYLGNMTFDISEGALRAINTLPIEQYLYGVVPHEMSNLFPVDALKAQAVAARGYAMARCAQYASRAYDILDTSRDQVYRGYASRNTRAIAAVEATRGQVLTYEGDIIEAYYSASNGGQTEKTGNVWETDLPYYTHADDPYDLKNESSIEETSFIPEVFNATTLQLMDPLVRYALEQAAYAVAGREVALRSTVCVALHSPSHSAPSRNFTKADITLMVAFAENGQEQTGQITITLDLEELQFGSFENMLGRIGASRTRLRLRGAERGTAFQGGTAYAGWLLTARRYGHGVGLSQRGAQERARAGQSYTDILSFYYVDAMLQTIGTYAHAPSITSQAYRVREWGISGIPQGDSVQALLDGLQSNGKMSIVNSKGRAAEGIVRTGYFVRCTYADGMAVFDLPIVVYGDLDGDGSIGTGDIEALQKHLLRAPLLTGPRLRAADVNHDGEVGLADLFRLIQSVNGDANITQGE